jgi:23S rRNA (adenine2503-C2)-methyltransferase|tara:strand:+ start:5573 stop:6658 length:1086 start_codon:yes stop_codon:yes gene_type:complete
MTKKLLSIRSLSIEEIRSFLEEQHIPVFRSKQIYDWLWKKNAGTFQEMKNIGKVLQGVLAEHFSIDKIVLKDEQVSIDKTLKCAFSIDEKSVVEGVLIPTTKRMTACISSQVGCSLACTFCATGKLKLLRNLSAGEIYDQVFYLKKEAEKRHDKSLSNIVYMGMGEPLLNYKNVLSSIDKICSPDGLGMSPRRITVSTAGICKMIKKLGDDEVKFNLALSLHAANDAKRNKIMEINESNNLDSLRESLEYFHEKTGSRITFEYIIFDGFNDTIDDARELADFAKCVPCKINIIEYNPIDGEPFQQAEEAKVDRFAQFLESKNLIVNIRRSRGKDIDAACGQLANKNKAIALDERSLKKSDD